MSNRFHGGNKAEYGGGFKDLSYCVNPMGMPEAVKQAVLRGMDELSQYPDRQAQRLRSRLESFLGVDRDCIVITNGASEGIYNICRALSGTMQIVAPVFTEYQAAAIAAGLRCVNYITREEDEFALRDDFVDEITPRSVTVICNPCNPTGQLLSRQRLENILAVCEDRDSYLLLDECFMELADENQSLCSLIEAHPRLIIIRAFTKSFAMPGLRVGYILCSNSTILDSLSILMPPWNTSAAAQMGAVAALGEKKDYSAREYLNASRSLIADNRKRLIGELTAHALVRKVYPSKANFVLVKAEEGFGNELKKNGVIIRQCDDFAGLGSEYFRVAVHSDPIHLLKGI